MNDTTVSLDFQLAKQAVAKQFAAMQKHPLFRVNATKEDMWLTYLKSFPPGTNPVFQKRTEHDCACCRHFIRDVGNVVAIVGGELVSIWDTNTGDPAYDTVFKEMSKLIHSKTIDAPFLHYERHAGTDKTRVMHGGVVTTWNHFHVNIAPAFVADKSTLPTVIGAARTSMYVFARGIKELTTDALNQFIELSAQGSLYRGTEFTPLVQKFLNIKTEYETLPEHKRVGYLWMKQATESPAVIHLRNSAAGTLLVNLSEGMELEQAVRAYEVVVAPTNYKRPTALVTPAMVAKAKAAVEALGLTTALQRRHAVLSDFSINNVLFADRSAKKVMQDVFDEVAATSAKAEKTLDKVAEMHVEDFIANVLPKIESMEVLVENRHRGNFVSLIAPTDPSARLLFKWPNAFSWSYTGEVTDSIKERVKAAGGKVEGDLCCRLAWNNTDDLDFYMYEPDRRVISFSSYRRNLSPSGGMLDVDANGVDGMRTDPVENIVYSDHRKMKEGTYTLKVHMFSKRGSLNPGYEVEIDLMGTVYNTESAKSPTGYHEIAQFQYSKKDGLKLITPLTGKRTSKQVWGVTTEQFQRVNVMMLSPNFWEGHSIGNQHYFFMLDGCANDESARGFYNEFLTPALDEHRKVMELVGSKTKPVAASEQLSGLGFSSTQRNNLTVRVKGSFTRTLKILF